MPDIRLEGCTPEPLMAYLKALGILRLVGEQADSDALGCWENDVFVLRTQLQKDELVDFFLEKYQPSPILGPWGARSGFFPGSSESKARDSLEKIENAEDKRLDKIKKTINEIRRILKEYGLEGKAKDEDKILLMQVCRSNLSDEILEWLDACYVLLGDDKKFPPLLGTGGNEGSGSYFSGFSQQVVACLINREFDSALNTSLYGELNQNVFSCHTPGHFSPKSTGGPNSSSHGFGGPLTTNPWDYLLCLEGSYLWASGVFRRYGNSESRIASFPFTVTVSGSGYESLCFYDSQKPKKAKRDIAEIWLPMWRQFIPLSELKMLLAEGRASIGRRMSINGVDMARAASGLGVDRGIDCFQRIAFFMRNGQSFIAIPLGKFEVHLKKDVDLIQEIDRWLSQFRNDYTGDNIQLRFQIALRKIESAIFNYCKYGGQDRMKSILTALGNAERELAVTGSICPPLSRLSTKWIQAVCEDSPEFQLSLSLAGIYDGSQKIGSIRRNLEPLDGNERSWNENSRENVWSGADLCANLSAVLERRLMDGARGGCQELPLHFRRPVSLQAVSAFLAGEVDDQYISDLLWGLILIDHRQEYPKLSKLRNPAASNYSYPLPRVYALLKLLFLPGPILSCWDHKINRRVWRMRKNGDHEEGIRIRPEPRILPLLKAGRIKEACRIAHRRLLVSGLTPLPAPTSSGIGRESEWIADPGIDPKRLAASLLFPIDDENDENKDNEIDQLIRLITRPKEEMEGVIQL